MIRVLLLDDHALTRTGYRLLLERAGDIAVVGECDSGEQALEAVARLRPDVLLCDLHLPGISGIAVADRLLAAKSPTRIVALSAQADGPLPRRMLGMGVHGYLSKGCTAREIETAIRLAYDGERYVGNEVARHLALSRGDGARGTPFDLLTAREIEIVLLLLRGFSSVQIAERLHRSNKTVSTHKINAMAKLGVRDLPALTRLALLHELIEPASL